MGSMYLISQYLLNLNDWLADWKLEGLDRMYSAVGQVNRDFSNRLTDAADKDANINALVNLDCFATMIPFQAEEMFKKIKRFFQHT